jgi:MFS family permease
MTTPSPSDDKIVAAVQRQTSAWRRLIVSGFFAALILLGLLIAAAVYGLPQRLGLPAQSVHWLIKGFPLILLAGMALAVVTFLRRYRPIAEIERPSVQDRLVDYDTKRQRGTLAAAVLIVLFLGLAQPDAPTGHGPGFTQIAFVLIVLAAALMVVWGPGFLNPRFRRASSDEFSQALRGRATAFGYMVAMAALGIEFCISQFAPAHTAEAIPLSLAAAFVVPALYYVIADWRAGREK